MKKLFAMLLVAAIALSLAACSQTPPEPAAGGPVAKQTADLPPEEPAGGGAVKVAFITDTMNEAVQGGLAHAQKFADARGFELVVFDSKTDLQTQMDNLAACVSQGIDYAIIIPLDMVALSQAMIDTANAGVVVFPWSYTESLDNIDNIFFRYVDQVEQGYAAGQAFAAALGGTGKVAMISGMAGNASAVERAEGFEKAIAEYPNMELVMDVQADWDRAKAMTAAENILTANGDIAAIFVHDDTMAVGAAEGIKGSGYTVGGEDGILLASVGGMAEAINMVESGETLCTIKYPDQEQIGSMFEAMADLEAGKTPERVQVVNSIVIDAGNYAQYK